MSCEKEIFDEKEDEKCNDKGVYEEMVEKEMSTEGGIFLTEKEESQDNFNKYIGKKRNFEKVDENDEHG